MDPLSRLVKLARPSGLNWKTAELSGRWLRSYPASPGVAFCLVVAGRCRARTTDAKVALTLGAADFLLLVRPPAWTLEADEEGGRTTRIVGGHFRLDAGNAALLTDLLPALVSVRASEPRGGRVHALIDLIGDEAQAERPGQSLVVERLIEVLLVEAVRLEAGKAAVDGPGLLAGLRDTRIGAALRAFHGDVRRDWSVEGLAQEAGMSRSAFAERFSRLVGLPPLRYLLHWRMAVAKESLRSGDASLAEIADACGYSSASAFSMAFARVVGCPPATYRGSRAA